LFLFGCPFEGLSNKTTTPSQAFVLILPSYQQPVSNFVRLGLNKVNFNQLETSYSAELSITGGDGMWLIKSVIVFLQFSSATQLLRSYPQNSFIAARLLVGFTPVYILLIK